MKRALLLLPLTLIGCGAWSEAQLGLVDQIERGLSLEEASAAQRHAAVQRALDDRRRALDEAFDGDAVDAELSADWVIEARQGYAAGLDSLARQRQALAEQKAADAANREAARQAAAELRAMLEFQRRLAVD